MNYAKLRQIKKLYFDYGEIAKALAITLDSARVSAARLVKQGFLVRVKRNLYVLDERWRSLEREEFFILANLLQVPSYISLMTALSYYEITTQLQRSFFESVAVYRTKEIEIGKTIFNYSKIDERLYFGFSKQKGFFIATQEKAFLDAVYLMSLKRYRFDLGSIDLVKLDKEKIKRMATKFPARTQNLLRQIWIF